MFHIFYSNNPIRYPSYIDKEWDYIHSKYITDYNRITEYYRNRVSPVPNNHVLNRILLQILKSIPDTVTDEVTVMAHIDAVVNSISREFKISSISTKGNVIESGLYRGSRDILVYTEFDTLFDTEDDWREWVPVKLIYHTDTTLDLIPPNLTIKSDNLYVYYIDYKLLYRQYHSWCLERGDNVLDTRLYIPQYVLPNLMKSLIDISVVNRYINQFNGVKSIPIEVTSPILLTNYTNRVERLIRNDLKKLESKRISYVELLYNIATIFDKRAYKTLYLNDYLYNNNNRFILYVTRIGIIRFLFQLLGDKGLSSNSDLLSLLQTEILLMQNSKDLEHLPEDIQVEVMGILDDIEFM